jgi:phage terminase small subunit
MGKCGSRLTARRLAFVREYTKDWNGTQAAIRAGYSPRVANRQAYVTLRDPLVAGEIQKRARKLSVAADVTADRVLRELARIAFADTTHVIRITRGRIEVVDTDQLTTDERAAIAEIRDTENGIGIKFHDKTKALELLGKYHGLFVDRHEVTGEEGGPLVVVQEGPKS